jgi:general secretion pathway protein D
MADNRLLSEETVKVFNLLWSMATYKIVFLLPPLLQSLSLLGAAPAHPEKKEHVQKKEAHAPEATHPPLATMEAPKEPPASSPKKEPAHAGTPPVAKAENKPLPTPTATPSTHTASPGIASKPLSAAQETELADELVDATQKSTQKHSAHYKQDKQEVKATALSTWQLQNPEALVELNFNDVELSSVLAWAEKTFGVTFIVDDLLKPMPQGAKTILGVRINFKTHTPITQAEAALIIDTFLDIAGAVRTPGPTKSTYRILNASPNSPTAYTRAPLPTYIGVEPSLLPGGDARIRYVYFVSNTNLDVIQKLIDAMKSSTAPNLIVFPELRAIMITDKASTIKSLMLVIKELDRVAMPETLAIVRLKRTDANKVAALYQTLVSEEAQLGTPQPIAVKSSKEQVVFSDTTRVIAEPRTNSLIILGPRDTVAKIESFIVTQVDKNVELPFSPVFVHQLKYIDAASVANILKQAVAFQPDSDAAKVGGVRDGDQYFKRMTIVPEPSGNRLIVNASHEDYQRLCETLERLDVEQPQVALKVMVLSIDLNNKKQLGVQMRNRVTSAKSQGLFNRNVNYQTSGLFGQSVVENDSQDATGAQRLLGDLIQLASNSTIGSTLITLGSDIFGVWGLLQILETTTRVNVVATPFVVASQKTQTNIAFGDIRRVQSATIYTQATAPTYFDLPAKLELTITPQISLDGLVSLDVIVNLSQFTSSDLTNGDRTSKSIQTSVIVADNEVLALGGLIKDTVDDSQNAVPILGNIPLFGWLFKNKRKHVERESLLILITPEIIPVAQGTVAERFTNGKLNEINNTIEQARSESSLRDPVNRWFFKEHKDCPDAEMVAFKKKATLPSTTASCGLSFEKSSTCADEEKKDSRPTCRARVRTPDESQEEVRQYGTYKKQKTRLIDMLSDAS